jgi:hypothetical protein
VRRCGHTQPINRNWCRQRESVAKRVGSRVQRIRHFVIRRRSRALAAEGGFSATVIGRLPAAAIRRSMLAFAWRRLAIPLPLYTRCGRASVGGRAAEAGRSKKLDSRAPRRWRWRYSAQPLEVGRPSSSGRPGRDHSRNLPSPLSARGGESSVASAHAVCRVAIQLGVGSMWVWRWSAEVRTSMD